MRLLEDIRKAIRANFIENFVMRELYGLNPDKIFDEQFSPVSIEAQYADIVANAIYNHEYLVNERANEIELQIAAEYPFSIAWYYAKSLSFQLGDALTFDEKTYKFSYPTINPAKQIIKYVAVRQLIIDNLTKLRVYVTKSNKQALNASELLAFKSFISQIGAAGTHFEFVSQVPNNLELNYTVSYDPQILNYSGERLSGGGKPVDEAAISYLNNIKYGGSFNRTRNVDAIQLADGIVDVVLGDVYMNDDLNNMQSFESPSGFFNAQTINVIYTPYYEG
ncbi:MAG: hypothetical protein LBJ72_12625 [Dysgonamonadaceae bacterium]|jgi:hypothetical protein|nr:hypothetical protein [Dysgonamonadaceae bacterium]